MQPAVRKALTNLQGIYDEGFMSKQEYEKRRKAIIDGATSLPADGGPRVVKAASAPAKKSVFDRLGADANAGADADSWAHDGFEQMYGTSAAKASKGQKKGQRFAPYVPPGGRTVVVTNAAKGDLRSKLSGGAIRKPGRGAGRGRGAALPEKCPW